MAVELCQFSIDEQGVDAVSRKKWDLSKEEERAKFLADVDRRGPPVALVKIVDVAFTFCKSQFAVMSMKRRNFRSCWVRQTARCAQ